MSQKSSHQSLLGDLKRLYSDITLSLFNKRMGLYNKGSHALTGHDVSARLSDHIEKLAAAEKAKPSPQPQSQPTQSPISAEAIQTDTTDSGHTESSRSRPSVVGQIVTALSSHLKGQASYEIQPQLSEKLKNSAWSHVHSALRYARQGDEVNAKLHVNIACNALKEAEHYISDEACDELSAEVEKLLEQIKEQS